MTIYTVMCGKFGCLWQSATEDSSQAETWRNDHDALREGHR